MKNQYDIIQIDKYLSKEPISVRHTKQSSEELILELAKLIYSYGDFKKIKNNEDFARECIKRAIDFDNVYQRYILKGSLEDFYEIANKNKRK